MKKILSIPLTLCLIFIWGCRESRNEAKLTSYNQAESMIPKVAWSVVDSINIDNINKDLEADQYTLDIGVYFPSNLDSAFKKVTMQQLLTSIEAAKEIYKPTGVQINLLWVKTGALEPRFFSIQSSRTPGVPQTEYSNMYQHMNRHPAILTKEAEMAFESIIEDHPDNHRTIYIIVLQEVFYPFLDVAEGRNWMIKTVRTGGLSFPPYSYVNSMPAKTRGIITITNLERPDRLRSTIAHEIGHKAINVSHEYREINPENEVFAEGGLMVYGSGEEIPSGVKGRWHLERLLLSPFLYKLNENGTKDWNPDFREGGHYYDPIYGEKVIRFSGKSKISSDW